MSMYMYMNRHEGTVINIFGYRVSFSIQAEESNLLGLQGIFAKVTLVLKFQGGDYQNSDSERFIQKHVPFVCLALSLDSMPSGSSSPGRSVGSEKHGDFSFSVAAPGDMAMNNIRNPF